MTYKNNIILIAFAKPHLFKDTFIDQWKNRFPTLVIEHGSIEQQIKAARNEYDHVTLITDVEHLKGAPHDRFVLKGKSFLSDGPPFSTSVGIHTFFLTNRLFYEMLSWLLEHRFPDKYNLL